MYCLNCGTQLPDNSSFCYKCGAKVNQTRSATGTGATSAAAGGNLGGPAAPSQDGSGKSTQQQIIAPSGVTSMKCPNCGAPISPKLGEMVITCEYCGSGIALGSQGWTNIQKQTMLPIKIATTDAVNEIIRPLMDKGFLHRHLQEDSQLEEMTLSYVPYWIVSVSARTTVVCTAEAQQVGQAATTAALMGVIFGGMGGGFGGGGGGGMRGGGGGRRRVLFDLGAGLLGTAENLLGSALSLNCNIMAFNFGGFGMGYGGGGGGARKSEQMDENYNFPVVALKALTAYQPRDYQFALDERALFDVTKVPKNVKVLNGDISEDVAKSQAKTLVDQLQSEKAHAKYHMIQQINTVSEVGDPELLHAPIWFARYDHKGEKIALAIDANSGKVINSIGL